MIGKKSRQWLEGREARREAEQRRIRLQELGARQRRRRLGIVTLKEATAVERQRKWKQKLRAEWQALNPGRPLIGLRKLVKWRQSLPAAGG